ncbi:hypothetical protein PC9H_009755 [Pleurotus ostreatus]|uniref:Uncharacterized protein n=1 Tax=Pleurotus ostreatus TaxID=5322 RepID=A0A8H6ZMI4_PLEOS|nr:uncharacterized protein PC9H_009755 [Pleurotus ostreatus]KAF7424448.1 hypothetical protein PC9H_009755 [Pleurotus ostreatus]
MPPKRKRTGTSSELRTCAICGQDIHARGMAAHRKKCEKDRANALHDMAEKQLQRAAQVELEEFRLIQAIGPAGPADTPDHNAPAQFMDEHEGYRGFSPIMLGHGDRDGVQINDDPSVPFAKDDIKTEYHPHSRKVPTVQSFNTYQRRPTSPPVEASAHNNSLPPWSPFRSRLDFEVASLALDAALKKEHVEALISLLKRCGRDPQQFTIQNAADIDDTWTLATHKAPEFIRDDIEVEYDGEMMTFEMWYRPLWDWALSLVQDSSLVPYFEWNSQRLYKFNGTNFVRFVDEPLTGEQLWNMESDIPEDGTPFFFILYADKSKLSSFGTAKAYPVIARCANLCTSIRNGRGIGGGTVVGWLPVIKEDSEDSGKRKFIIHKSMVWHQGIGKILKSVQDASYYGYWVTCGDSVKRRLFPIDAFHSHDYEEACIMTGTRGVRSLFPCPVCLVPRDMQMEHGTTYPLRTTKSMKAVYDLAMAQLTKKDQEAILKEVSLREIENAFWAANLSDPYKGASFDPLHTFDNGLFEDHLFAQAIERIQALGTQAVGKFDTQFDLIPRWRNLHHFESVSNIAFNDGSKNLDISKLILFASYNILTKNVDATGYLLLRCLRAYINMRMYAGMQVHTDDTITAGREAVEVFSVLIKASFYANESNKEAELPKNWNFPKNHLYVHLFDDIVAKGVTRNYNTKPSEQMHRSIRKTYFTTNFKDIAPQILGKIHSMLVAEYIWQDIGKYDEELEAATADLADGNATPGNNQESGVQASHHTTHLSLTVAQPPLSFKELEVNHINDSGPKFFHNFHIRLANFLSQVLPVEHLPNARYLRLSPNDKIVEFRYVKVNYESCVTWTMVTDHLWCNPNFHGHPRYDHVIVKTEEPLGVFTPFLIGKLLFMFHCSIQDKVYYLALIDPLDALIGPRRITDIELGLIRLRTKPHRTGEFIFVDSIIRGALVVEAFDTPGDYLLVDTLDDDMFLRYKQAGL